MSLSGDVGPGGDSLFRLAVLGLGRMGSFHLTALDSLDFVDVCAVLDVRSDIVEQAARRVGAEPFRTLEDLKHAADVDGWLIATPTPTHPDLVRAGLRAGVHILCEKPLSLGSDDHHELETLSRGEGLVLQVGFWRRFSPPWQLARDLIARGAIGDPLFLRLSQWDANPPPADFCDPDTSGGLAIDCGVHEYDLAEWLTGRQVERVSAKYLPVVDPDVRSAGDVDNLLAILELEGGTTATVDLTRNARYGDDVRTEVLGSDGAVFVETLPAGKTRLANSAGVSVIAGSQVTEPQAAGVVEQARVFVRAARGHDADIPGAMTSLRTLVIGRAVQEAALSGRVVVVGEEESW